MKKATKVAPKKVATKTTKKVPAKAPKKVVSKTEVGSWGKESAGLKSKYPQLTDQQLHQYDGETIESAKSRVAEAIGINPEDL